MIHACPQRMWYVTSYLVPSMLSQGIAESDITIYNDVNRDGNLVSCMKSFGSVPDDDGGTWHLQDDVLISKRFKALTEEHDDGVVCGHCWSLHRDRRDKTGFVTPDYMWFSFQCIRIPNRISMECSKWFFEEVIPQNLYEGWVRDNKYDDTMFDVFMRERHPNERVLNLAPNTVANIDYMIGGTIISQQRVFDPEEIYFHEPETLEKLIEWIGRRESDG